MAESEDRLLGQVKFFSTRKEQDRGGFGFIDLGDGEDIHYNGSDYPEGFFPKTDDIVELTIAPNGPNKTTAKDIEVLWTFGGTNAEPIPAVEPRNVFSAPAARAGEQLDFFLEGHRGELFVSLSYKVDGKPEAAEFQMFLGNFQNPLIYPQTDAQFPEEFLVKTDNRGVAAEPKNFNEFETPMYSHLTIVSPHGQRITLPIPVPKKEKPKVETAKEKTPDKLVARVQVLPEGESVARAPQSNSKEIRTFAKDGARGSEKIRLVFDDGVATLKNQMTGQVLEEGANRAENVAAFDFTTPPEGIINLGISYPGRSRQMRVVHLETGETVVAQLKKV